jgi:hypothetical protein
VLLAVTFLWENRKKAGALGAAPSGIWLSAVVIGLVLMLVIPVLFFEEGNRSSGYRSVNAGSITNMIRSALSTALLFGSYYSAFANITVSIASACVIYCCKESRSDLQNRCLSSFHIVSTLYLLVNGIFCDNAWYGAFSTPRKLITMFFIAIQFGVWIFACFALRDQAVRNKIFALLGYAAVSLTPLLIVSPTPLRVMYLPYFLIAAAVLLSMSELAHHLTQAQKVNLSFVGITAVATVMVVFCMMFLNIWWMAKTRDTYIAQKMQEGATEIEVFEIPYEYVFWDGIWCFKKKYHYETQGDIVFTEVDFTTWMDEHYAQLSQAS